VTDEIDSIHMSKTLAEMTEQDLRELVGDAVEERLLEILVDPDEKAEVRPEFLESLHTEHAKVLAGDLGCDLHEVAKELELR